MKALSLTNDLSRIVSIYSISTPLKRIAQVPLKDGATTKLNMLNDILSLMFYHQVISHNGFTYTFQEQLAKLNISSAMAEDILKTTIIIISNAVLNGNFTVNTMKTLVYALVGVFIYHLFVRPHIINTKLSKFIGFESIEDVAETILLLSLDNPDPVDITSKLLGLVMYHKILKMN